MTVRMSHAHFHLELRNLMSGLLRTPVFPACMENNSAYFISVILPTNTESKFDNLYWDLFEFYRVQEKWEIWEFFQLVKKVASHLEGWHQLGGLFTEHVIFCENHWEEFHCSEYLPPSFHLSNQE